MLRLTELKDALRLMRAVGDRRHGHFDHDARSLAGPDRRSHQRLAQEAPEGFTLRDAYGAPCMESYEHPSTGELLFRTIAKS